MSEIFPSSCGAEPSLQISQETFRKLGSLVTRLVGIKMPDSKVSMLQSRLMRRVRELDLSSIDEYCDYLFSLPDNSEERVVFIDAMTTNKTDFFRERMQFDFLVKTALPDLESASLRYGGSQKILAWSAACSSGEEPYTLAMVLNEYIAARPQVDYRILATDISTRVLQVAEEGIYSRQQIEPVPRELRHKYLCSGKGKQQSLVRIAPALRARISFHRLNLMDSDYAVNDIFEIIFCRNVLIYFDRETQEAVISRLCRKLAPGGYLFISQSESLSGFQLPLVAVATSCYQKQDK